jgi:K+-sensing histidine kinase KdpD
VSDALVLPHRNASSAAPERATAGRTQIRRRSRGRSPAGAPVAHAGGQVEPTLATAELMLEIATAVSTERPLGDILRDALVRLGEIVPFDSGAISLIDGTELVVHAAIGPAERDLVERRFRRSSDVRWAAISEGQTIRIDDMRHSGDGMAGPRSDREIRSWLGVPIVRRGEGIGLLEIDAGTPGAFRDEQQDLVATVGRALAGPVDVAARFVAERKASVMRDAFIGIISHELRTPITTIFGMSQVLAQRHATMDPESRSQMIEDIGGEADRLRRLAEDLLVLSRSESGRLTLSRDPLLVGHVVRRRIADASTRWPEHRFSAEIPAGLPLVLGEEMYVEQVVQNLLSNATKYSPAGSEVRVVVSHDARELSVRVLDAGMGFAQETPETLFELFYRSATATRSASGAGIGLFVCRELIRAMGGRIWARSRDPVGSEFGFALPVLEGIETLDGVD